MQGWLVSTRRPLRPQAYWSSVPRTGASSIPRTTARRNYWRTRAAWRARCTEWLWQQRSWTPDELRSLQRCSLGVSSRIRFISSTRTTDRCSLGTQTNLTPRTPATSSTTSCRMPSCAATLLPCWCPETCVSPVLAGVAAPSFARMGAYRP